MPILTKKPVKKCSWLLAALAFVTPLALAAQENVQVHYVAPRNPNLQPIARAFSDGRLLESFAGVFRTNIRFPRTFHLVARECGVQNAFYDPQQNAINLCYELMNSMLLGITQAFAARNGMERAGNIYGGALAFVVMHELGHALIKNFNVPVLGKEEDAADQIAIYLMLLSKDKQLTTNAVVGAHWFFRQKSFLYTRAHFADEHSLDPQRQYNIVCWTYGSDANYYRQLAIYARLPQHRAQRCEDEYRQLKRSVTSLIGRFANLPEER